MAPTAPTSRSRRSCGVRQIEGLIPHGQPPVYFTFPGLARAGLAHATTTRHCPGLGSPADPASPFASAETRAALAPAGLDLARAAWARQVHGADVAVVPADGGFAGVGDILVTRERGLPLAIFTADCLALTLWDAGGALAVAHAGWRGLARGVVEAALGGISAAGGELRRLRVSVAPSIGPCCYEVDGPVIAAFSSAYPELWERWARPGRPDHWMLDLWTAAEELLERAGVPRTHIENARLCTACNPELLYSYRKGHRGRLATIAALP